ncbi:uncharacterized protein DUF3231 [Tumebacillus sp. BK434]|uniref:DUF3231 family protein n=1 Tax=Tumebacillus sp. BK434 TaxID=2512169 RepID=UPI0010DD350E|nr:DUF3231 family protein [Tumebacillus sp. BK434]TCP52186.1 uncharacterized protein DUF3231 [Tumebacillus sp. BK434]
MQTNRLVSAELGSLWQTYQYESMSHCILTYFDRTLDDPEGKLLLRRLLDLQEGHLAALRQFFERERIPLPCGYTETDVHPGAPKLFNDAFILQFVAFMNQVALEQSQMSLSTAPTRDLRHFLMQRLHHYTELEDATFELLLEKGLFVRAPYVPYPTEVTFVQDPGFLAGLLGNKQPLNVLETGHLFINSIRNQLGTLLMTGLIQTVQEPEIREYLLKGKQLAREIAGIFDSVTKEAELPPAALISVEVTDATEPPFSDRLILNFVTALNTYGLGIYGFSLAHTTRADLAAQLVRIIGETGKYGTEGLQLLIKYGYLEAPPATPNRQKLAKQE